MHLRNLGNVRLPNGNVAQFRFFDPRVLRAFIPTCAADELASLFGPIREFTMEAEDPNQAASWTFAQRKLQASVIDL